MGADPNRLVRIGVIGRAHGIHGEVYFRPDLKGSATLTQKKTVVLHSEPEGFREWNIESARVFSGGILLKLAGVADRTQAERLAGRKCFVPRSSLPELEDGEFYFFDLLGLQAQTPRGELMGEVANLIDTGGVPVLEIVGKKELQVPLADVFVKHVDLEQGTIIVEPPEEES